LPASQFELIIRSGSAATSGVQRLVMPGRLLHCMPPTQIVVLSSGVWWALLLDIHYLWRHNMMSY